MQCAARSAPASRRRPAACERISFVPTLSVEAARSRRSSSAYRPAKPPKPPTVAAVWVDSAAARSRPTTASAVASDTPAASYVPATESSLGIESDEELRVELGPALRPAGQEADERLSDLDARPVEGDVEDLGQRGRLRLRIVC